MTKKSQNWIFWASLLCLSISFLVMGALAFSQQQEPKPSITLQAMQDVPDNKSLREITSSADFNGTLVYGDFAPLPSPNGPKWTPFLKTSKTGIDDRPSAVSAFRVNGTNNEAFDPQFSPDGKLVMFKVGVVGESHSYYQLCFWNRATNQVQMGPNNLNYLNVYWSPDSNYVAYISGGDIEGNEAPRDPLRLYIYDVKARQSHFVAQNPMAKIMAWTQQNTLMYNVKQQEQPEAKNTPKRSYLADVYVASTNGKSNLFLKNAFDPRPSPDGKKVAFFAWPEPDTSKKANEKSQVQSQLGLYSYDREQKKRTLLRPTFSRLRFVGMRWMPDNRHLVTLETLSQSPQAKVQVEIIDTVDSTTKKVVVLQANDFQAIGPRIETQPQFQPLEVCDNGKQLFIKVSEIVGIDSPLFIEEKSLQAINLDTGRVIVVAKVRSSLGIDWHSANVKSVGAPE
jgi:dipeptidyl aminopeptidase/acylaminoacyl peptidase